MKELEEMEKALVETYELNASLRKENEKLKAEKKVLNINWKTALKINNDLLNENRKLKEENDGLEEDLADTHYKMVRYKKAIEILKEKGLILKHYSNSKNHEFVFQFIGWEYMFENLTPYEYELLKEVLE